MRAEKIYFNSSMVRLKVDVKYNTTSAALIFQFLNGSIKRDLAISGNGSSALFQFLNGSIKRVDV